ncbi:MAG TPA: TonB-dependent receptor [Alphaproteobacteria bacterium]|nr:TonB-dependent receptor [Alphaproteobacteria bacterium]
MTSHVSTFLYGTALGVLAAGGALAQDSASQNARLEEIVVTASRVPQDARTVGSSVSVITGQEISQLQERFVLDALTTTPGLDAAMNGGPGGVGSVFIRGADSYQTMVLIDGVPVDDPSGPQSAYNFGRLLATDIDRIEILRGPQSTLYGGDAIGGVINIITDHGRPGFNASGLMEFGSFASHTFSGSVSGGTEQATGYINVSQYNTDGFPAADERFGNHVKDGLEETQATAGGHLAPTEWLALDLALRSADSEGGYPNSFGPNGMPADEPNEARNRERSGRLALSTNLIDGAFTQSLAFMDSIIHRNQIDFEFGSDTFSGERRKAEYLATGKPLDWLSLLGGLSWQQDRAHSVFDSERTAVTRALFGELQAHPISGLYLTAGGRIDDHSAFGPFRTYRVTGAYLIDETGTKLHAAVGTGFRAPSLFELYDGFSGNSFLKPETSRGWEFGVDQTIFDGVTLKATYFNQRIENRIDFDEATFVYFNEGHTKAQGVEMEVDVQPLQSLTLRAVYTYDLENALDSGVQIVRRPRNSASLIAAWQATDPLLLTLKVHAVGSRRDADHALAGYVTADIGAEYQLLPYLTLQGRIENISDTHYEEVFGYGTEGRAVFGGVTMKY